MSTITENISTGHFTVHKQSGSWSVGGAAAEPDLTFGTRIQAGETSIAGMSSIVREPNRTVSSKRGTSDKQTPKVKRRLQGFFIQEEGQEARVALVDNGVLVHYYLPLALLHEGNVRIENQPFELDELEIKVDGVVMSGHRVRASAPAEAGVVSPLPLNVDYQQKLNRILSH
jgi:hypothetical protein